MAMTGGTAVLLKTGYPNYGAEKNFPLRLYLYYKVVSQNKATAVTTMSLGMYFVCPDKWYVGAWSDYGSYLGSTSNTFSKSVPSNFTGTLWLAENITFNVQHDAQGKGTAKIAWKWGVDSSYGQFESPSGTYSVSLPDIPRTSSVSVGGAVNAGSSLTINIGRASSSFTHTLRYAFGSASGTIATGVGTSYNWSVPYDLLRQIPSASSGVGTIYCDTYYSGTAIGTSSCAFTINAPNNESTKPTASMMLSPSGSVPSAFSGMYIRGKTAVKADFTAEPKYGTSIKSYALSVNGKTTTGDPATSEVLSTSGSIAVTGTVTDARGFSRALSQNITVHAYDAPGVAPGTGQNAVICERADANGISSPSGTYLRIIAKRRYSSVDGINKCALRYRVKLSSASSYGSWVTILADGTTEDEYSGAIADVVPSVTTSYDVQIGVVDTMGTEASITFRIPTDSVSFHIREGGKGAAFFGYSEKDNELSLSGKRISNLGTPTETGDAVPLGYAQGAFAPAGYGLGENIGRYCADCHDTSLQGGLYYVDINTANCIGVPSAPLLVQTADSTNGKVIYLTLITGANVVRCYYSAWSKAWQPWEWLNPPMSPDVEYRTAERWNGSAVYTKFLNCGMIPNSSTKSVDTGIPKSSNMIIGGSFSLINTPKTYLRTEAPDSFDYVFDATSTTNYFVKIVTTAGGYSDYTAYFVIRYVKI